MKVRKKTVRKSNKKHNNYTFFYIVFSLIIGIPLTVFVASNAQTLRQFAQSEHASPPIYGCLSAGESDSKNCASLLIQADVSIKLHGTPLKNQSVNYGDKVTGTVTYKNNGDVPMEILSMGLAARHKNSPYRTEFLPKHKPTVLQPGETITLKESAHLFNKPDPGGEWEVFATLTDKFGQTLDDFKPTKITVNIAGAGKNPAGKNPAGQGPAGQGPAGQGPAGQGPAGQGPGGQGPGGQGPGGQGGPGGNSGGGGGCSAPQAGQGQPPSRG